MSDWESLFGYAVEPGKYLYHYTSASTLAAILDSRSIRFGRYLNTNDPLETRLWLQTISIPGEIVDHLPHGWAETIWGPYVDVRERTRLACFTLDDTRVERLSLNLFHRGWCRPRMWSQYAAGHMGACLIIDKASWESRIDVQWPSGKIPAVDHGPVEYQDVPFGGLKDYLTFRWEELQPERLKETIENFLAEKGPELFFRKNRDWESENEYRYVTQSEQAHETVPLEEALVGIVITPEFPSTERSVLRHRLTANGFSDVPVAQLRWADGAPWRILRSVDESPSLPEAELQ